MIAIIITIITDIIDKLLSARELADPSNYLKSYCTPFDVTLDRGTDFVFC